MIIPHLFSLASEKARKIEPSSISLNQNKVLEVKYHLFVPVQFRKTDEYIFYILTASQLLKKRERTPAGALPQAKYSQTSSQRRRGRQEYMQIGLDIFRLRLLRGQSYRQVGCG